MSTAYEIGTPKLIEKAYGEKYGLCRIPGMVITSKGTIICYYEAREDFRDQAKIDIKVIRSTDGGESFEDVMTVFGDGDTMNNPVMIVNGDVIHFLYFRNYCQLYHSKSTDDGKSFSKAREITDVLLSDNIPYTEAAVGPGHGIVHGGRLSGPLWDVLNADDPKSHANSSTRTLYSEDNGESWKLGEDVSKGVLNDANESALAVNADGKVLMSLRHRTNEGVNRALALSSDGISGWSVPTLSANLPDPRCMGSMAHDNGSIYHINCTAQKTREDLTIKISRDCFESFESIYVSKYAGYSDIAVNDGTVYVFYERFHEPFHRKWNPNVKTTPDPEDGLYFVKIKKK